MGGKFLHALRNAAALPSIKKDSEPLGVFEFDRGSMDGRAHQRDHYIVVELLPSELEPSALRLLKDVSRLGFAASYSETPVAAFRDIAKLLRLMSGYDRVQIAKFTSDGKGQLVIDTHRTAEDRPAFPSISNTKRALNFISDTSLNPL